MPEKDHSSYREVLNALNSPFDSNEPTKYIFAFNFALENHGEAITLEHVAQLQLTLEMQAEQLTMGGSIVVGEDTYKRGVELIEASATPLTALAYIRDKYLQDAHICYERSQGHTGRIQESLAREANVFTHRATLYTDLIERLHANA